MAVAWGSILAIVGVVLLPIMLVVLLVFGILAALIRAARGGGRTDEERRQVSGTLAEIRKGTERMDKRIASLETILQPGERAGREARS